MHVSNPPLILLTALSAGVLAFRLLTAAPTLHLRDAPVIDYTAFVVGFQNDTCSGDRVIGKTAPDGTTVLAQAFSRLPQGQVHHF